MTTPSELPNPDDANREISEILSNHQVNTQDWQRSEISSMLQFWREQFAAEFKLHIPNVAFCVDKLPVRTLGYYRGQYNGFGLKREIAVNTQHITRENFWDVVGTFAHELIHAHQDATGTASKKRNHHNSEFCEIATQMGLIVNKDGVQTYVPNGKFFEILKKHGTGEHALALPDMTGLGAIPQAKKIAGKSKLLKWTCGCQSFRSGKKVFHAICTLCNKKFAIAGPKKKPEEEVTEGVGQINDG